MSESQERVRVTVNAGATNLRKGLTSGGTLAAVQIVGLLEGMSWAEKNRAVTMALAILKSQSTAADIPDWCMRDNRH